LTSIARTTVRVHAPVKHLGGSGIDASSLKPPDDPVDRDEILGIPPEDPLDHRAGLGSTITRQRGRFSLVNSPGIGSPV